MEYLSKKEKETLERSKDKDLLSLSKKEWELRHFSYDLDTMERLTRLKPKKMYGILRSVSSNGMQRTIDLFFINEENKPEHLHFYTNRIFKKRVKTANGWGFKISGCGMDMLFALVNSLSYSASQFLDLEELDGYMFDYSWF